MTYEECQKTFEALYEEVHGTCSECHKPHTSFKDLWERDPIMVREAFNDYTDSLCKDGEITQEQYENWDNPY
jgi:hypothetical protein